jgi:hypothetical protein
MRARCAMLALIAAASLSPPCQAQDQMETAKLTDPIVRKMIPLLKTMTEVRAATMSSQADAFANIGDLFVATSKSRKPITSGEEVLEAIRSYSDQAFLPPGLTFLPQTSKGWFDSTGMLFAAFTFGMKGDDALIGYFEKMQTDPLNETWAVKYAAAHGEDTPARRAALELFRKVDAFYQGKGFKVLGSHDGIKYYWQSPDGLVSAAFDYFNDLRRAEAKAGEKAESGPLITLQMAPRMDKPKPVEDPMPAALQKAEIAQVDFTAYLDSLLLAFRDRPREGELDSPGMPGMPNPPPDASEELIAQLNEA